MKKEVILLIAEDDEGHAALITKNIQRAGIHNKVIRFADGQETIDFLFGEGDGPHRQRGQSYVLLLDIRMPKMDGIEVLRRIKSDPEICKIPVIMLTTTDDPREIEKCHEIGCSNYITKPIDYEKFVYAVRQLGLFLLIIEVPKINGNA
ncbi:MAG: response regulator [Deltaproteobacteria bacterium]|nr:MAG: response regulator [Deltaproteobacteria bacterium]